MFAVNTEHNLTALQQEKLYVFNGLFWCNYKDENTFSKTSKRLICEIEQLFKDNLEEIVTKKFSPLAQRRKGTYHRVADLPKEFSGWDSNIHSEVTRLFSILNNK